MSYIPQLRVSVPCHQDAIREQKLDWAGFEADHDLLANHVHRSSASSVP